MVTVLAGAPSGVLRMWSRCGSVRLRVWGSLCRKRRRRGCLRVCSSLSPSLCRSRFRRPCLSLVPRRGRSLRLSCRSGFRRRLRWVRGCGSRADGRCSGAGGVPVVRRVLVRGLAVRMSGASPLPGASMRWLLVTDCPPASSPASWRSPPEKERPRCTLPKGCGNSTGSVRRVSPPA